MRRVPNLIGCRRILREMRKRAAEKEQKAKEELRLRNEATNREDYEYYRLVAMIDHEVAEELELFADQYEVF